MKLVVVIPALNEERTIGEVIGGIPKEIEGIDETEVIVVDDGSVDRTAELAEEKGAFVISHGANKGVGATFHTGLMAALGRTADVIVNIDGDGQFDPSDIPKLVGPIIEGEADFVTASRFKDKDKIPQMPKIKIWGNKRIANVVSFLTGQKFYDVSCGFRAYCRETAFRLNLFGKFTYTQESFLNLAYRGFRILEVPLKVRGEREFGDSRVASNLFRYAASASKIILRSFRDYKPLKFFGTISLFFLAIGGGLELFFFGHYLRTGSFSPHKWAAFLGAAVIGFGLIVFVIAFMADMFDRIRLTQEEILYYERKRSYDRDKT